MQQISGLGVTQLGEREVRRGQERWPQKQRVNGPTVPASGDYCRFCNLSVAKGDPDRVEEEDGSVSHKNCK